MEHYFKLNTNSYLSFCLGYPMCHLQNPQCHCAASVNQMTEQIIIQEKVKISIPNGLINIYNLLSKGTYLIGLPPLSGKYPGLTEE